MKEQQHGPLLGTEWGAQVRYHWPVADGHRQGEVRTMLLDDSRHRGACSIFWLMVMCVTVSGYAC